mmetsp:Transcript_41791/g.116538  ORF Transcript_41791/g.116538 Transcript_41791/m.116538 type:complete len:246 (-) Transcript_41791:22-759(-)
MHLAGVLDQSANVTADFAALLAILDVRVPPVLVPQELIVEEPSALRAGDHMPVPPVAVAAKLCCEELPTHCALKLGRDVSHGHPLGRAVSELDLELCRDHLCRRELAIGAPRIHRLADAWQVRCLHCHLRSRGLDGSAPTCASCLGLRRCLALGGRLLGRCGGASLQAKRPAFEVVQGHPGALVLPALVEDLHRSLRAPPALRHSHDLRPIELTICCVSCMQCRADRWQGNHPVGWGDSRVPLPR